MNPPAMTPHGRATGFSELVPTMSHDIRERREIEQKRKQVKDALAKRGIDTDGEDDDTEPDTLENDDTDLPVEEDDDVTADVLKNSGFDIDTLNDDFAVQDRLDTLNRKINWFEQNGCEKRASELKTERDALAKVEEKKPENGYGCMMDVRLALGEGRR